MSESVASRVARAPSDQPARIFIGWDGPALPRAAAALADAYLEGDELRMGGVTVVLPGARAGRRLKELLVGEAGRRGCRLVPPRVVTVGSLPELVHRPSRPAAGPVLSARAWVSALRELAPGRLAALCPEPPAPDDLRGWVRLAHTVQQLHREVCGAGLRFAEVVDRFDREMLFDDGHRWSGLAEAQERYAARLRALGRSDAGLARLEALEAGPFSLDGDLWLVGVTELPLVVRRMLERVSGGAGRVRSVVHAPEEEAAAFDELGCLVPEAWLEREVPLPEEWLEVRGRPAEQADEVVRALGELDGALAADEIVVSVSDRELLPHLEQRLQAAGVPVRAAEGVPAAQTPVIRLLQAFADYLDGHRFEACAALARHPDLAHWLRAAGSGAGGTASAPALREIDGWIEPLDRYFSRRLPARLDGIGPVDDPAVGGLRRALDHPSLLGGLRGRRRSAEWAQGVLDLLAVTFAEAELTRADPRHRRLAEACAVLRDRAADLSELPAEVDEACGASTAIRLLLDELSGEMIPPEPDAAAVELLGWLELHLDDAPAAVVTGFNEPFLPESLNADRFLPNALRTRLGLVDNDRRYARDAYQLTALLRSRRHVRVIAGRRSASGDPLRPSRLMFAVRGRRLAERVRRFYGSEADPVSIRRAADGSESRRPAEPSTSRFRLPPEPVISVRAPERIAVTDFARILADPYGFALQRLLRLEPVDDSAREMDGSSFGGLAHEVLELFGRSDAVHAGVARIRASLDASLDQRVAERFGDGPLPAVRLQVEMLRARLHAFASWHADWVERGWRVVGLECRTPEEGVSFEVDGEPIRVSGRIDRIDHHPELGWAVFDYKTGDRGRSPEQTHRAGRGASSRWTDLQLPLYRHLLPSVLDRDGRVPFAPAGGEPVRFGYVLLPRDTERIGPSFADWNDEDLASADACADDAVRVLRRGRYAFDAERLASYAAGPLAALVGVGFLGGVAAAEEAGDE